MVRTSSKGEKEEKGIRKESSLQIVPIKINSERNYKYRGTVRVFYTAFTIKFHNQ